MSHREYYCYLVICIQIVCTKIVVIQMDPNSLNAVIKKIHSLYKEMDPNILNAIKKTKLN